MNYRSNSLGKCSKPPPDDHIFFTFTLPRSSRLDVLIAIDIWNKK